MPPRADGQVCRRTHPILSGSRQTTSLTPAAVRHCRSFGKSQVAYSQPRCFYRSPHSPADARVGRPRHPAMLIQVKSEDQLVSFPNTHDSCLVIRRMRQKFSMRSRAHASTSIPRARQNSRMRSRMTRAHRPHAQPSLGGSVVPQSSVMTASLPDSSTGATGVRSRPFCDFGPNCGPPIRQSRDTPMFTGVFGSMVAKI